jgi:hypothetical protein
VRRLRAVIALPVALVALAACGGGDDEAATPSPAPTSESAAPPNASGLPPEFVQCMTDQGFDIQSPDDIHTAPQQVLQSCFGSLHQGGGAP